MFRRTLLGLAAAAAAGSAAFWSAGGTAGAAARGSAAGFGFAGVDGGRIEMRDFAGGPVLVVNTASRCGFTDQYAGLQALSDRFGPRGLTVIGVSSDSFRQELATNAAVKEFCEVNFSIDFPITEITPVVGRDAHPFYVWAREQGVAPMWNFHKILLDGEGRIAGSFGATVAPESPRLVSAVEALLPR